MMRLVVFGCYLTGSLIAISGVFMKIPEAIWAGTGLAAIGIAGKYGQKTIEDKHE
ncbi:MAG: hypothetical protein ACTSPI_00295 [Candidatus Heimdallarchaeaceae archaeon]